jgi:Homeodomain-like domain
LKLHANAKTCPNSRALIVERGVALASAQHASGWRGSAPRGLPGRTPLEQIAAIDALRRLRLTAAEISIKLGMALATVSRWLKRIGLGKRSRPEPPEPPNRYERARPGELVHVDIKKLGRFRQPGHRVTGRGGHHRVTQTTDKGRGRGVVGWDFVHVCVDERSPASPNAASGSSE